MYFEAKIEIVLKTEKVFWVVSDILPLKKQKLSLSGSVSWCFQLVWFIVSVGSRFTVCDIEVQQFTSFKLKEGSIFLRIECKERKTIWIFSTIGCKTEPLINDLFIRISALPGCSEKLYHVLWGKVILSRTSRKN